MAAATSSCALLKQCFCVVLLLGLLALAPRVKAAVTCDVVYGELYPCLGFVSGGSLDPRCCPGIRSAVGSANTKPDRQSLCGCLKALAVSYSSKVGKAQALLKICSVSLSFPIDPNVDCSRIN